MGFLEYLKNGDIKSIILVILIVLIFYLFWCKDNKEPMADVSVDIKEAIKQVYLADVEAIRNLSEVATKLQKEGLTIPGNLTVTGTIKSQSLDSLNSKIDSVNSSLNSSISSTNTNLTNNLANNVSSLQSQTNSINSNFNNYINFNCINF